MARHAPVQPPSQPQQNLPQVQQPAAARSDYDAQLSKVIEESLKSHAKHGMPGGYVA
jgi:hypothetical protein